MFLSTFISRVGIAVIGILLFMGFSQLHAAVSTFEGISLSNEQAYTGPGGGRYWSGLMPPVNDSINSSFQSGAGSFLNTNTNFSSEFGDFTFWNGFAYSNTADTTTPGFGNQYSAITGSGFDSDNYGVGFGGGTSVEFTSPTLVNGAYFTNTTYTYLSMLNGDAFAKSFGGLDGSDPDFFNLIITGLDDNNDPTGSVVFALADFTFADNSEDFIIDSWEWVDLSSLGYVNALSFDFESSDVSFGFINTPTYFAIDDLTTVPVPAALWLMLSGLIGMYRLGKRR